MTQPSGAGRVRAAEDDRFVCICEDFEPLIGQEAETQGDSQPLRVFKLRSIIYSRTAKPKGLPSALGLPGPRSPPFSP